MAEDERCKDVGTMFHTGLLRDHLLLPNQCVSEIRAIKFRTEGEREKSAHKFKMPVNQKPREKFSCIYDGSSYKRVVNFIKVFSVIKKKETYSNRIFFINFEKCFVQSSKD